MLFYQFCENVELSRAKREKLKQISVGSNFVLEITVIYW